MNAALTLRLPYEAPRLQTSLAGEILGRSTGNPFILSASGANGEGGLIAAFAALDRDRVHYVIKASQLPADTDFGGVRYVERFPDPVELRQWIEGNHIGWLVLDDRPWARGMPHVRQLLALVESGQVARELTATKESRRGTVRLFLVSRSRPTHSETAEVVRKLLSPRAAAVLREERQ